MRARRMLPATAAPPVPRASGRIPGIGNASPRKVRCLHTPKFRILLPCSAPHVAQFEARLSVETGAALKHPVGCLRQATLLQAFNRLCTLFLTWVGMSCRTSRYVFSHDSDAAAISFRSALVCSVPSSL